jgi:hypothetical protein
MADATIFTGALRRCSEGVSPAFFILYSDFASRPGQFIKDFPAGRFADFTPGPGFFTALTPIGIALNFPA